MPKILAGKKTWFDMWAKTTKDDAGKETQEAEILVYDYIGWGGVTAQNFVAGLKSIKAEKITVALNTPGGDVFDGLAIFNAMKAHPAEITVRIDGLAASIGSIIALAGDKIEMASSAFMMIHNPWGITVGNANEMRAMAATLDKIGGSLEDIYHKATGMSMKAVKAAMDAETWYTAEEAKASGFVHTVIGEDKKSADARMSAAFDLSTLGYANAPALYVARLKAVQDSGTGVSEEEAARVSHMRQRLQLVEADEASR